MKKSLFLLKIGILFLFPFSFVKAQSFDVNSNEDFSGINYLDKTLFDAIADHDDYKVMSLLNQGANPNGVNDRKQTPLHWASYFGNASIVRILILSNANINALTNENYTPLHLAAQQGNTQVVKALLEYGALKEIKNKDEFTPLHMASFYNHPKIIDLLVDYGANIEAKSIDDSTPLHLAAQNGAKEALLRLIAHKANINAFSNLRGNALHFAIHGNHYDIVKILLENGIDVNKVNSSKATPFVWNGYIGNVKIAQLLLQYKANPKITNIHHYTALHTAAMRGKDELLRFLIKQKIYNAKELSDKGFLAIDYAAFYGHKKALDALMQASGGVEGKDNQGQMVLFFAVMGNQVEMVSYLIKKYHALTQVKDFSGNRLFDLAHKWKVDRKILDFLRS
jgi:ankyrin repeat protein